MKLGVRKEIKRKYWEKSEFKQASRPVLGNFPPGRYQRKNS